MRCHTIFVVAVVDLWHKVYSRVPIQQVSNPSYLSGKFSCPFASFNSLEQIMKNACHISQILILKLIKPSKKHFTLCTQCLVRYRLIQSMPAGCSNVGVLGVPRGVTRGESSRQQFTASFPAGLLEFSVMCAVHPQEGDTVNSHLQTRLMMSPLPFIEKQGSQGKLCGDCSCGPV